jgi:hypothetical protein
MVCPIPGTFVSGTGVSVDPTWSEAISGFGCATGEEVADDEGEVREKFSDFRVGEDKRKDSA